MIMIAGLLAGCSDGGGSGNGGGGGPDLGPEDVPVELPPSPPDPCTLVTTEEATAALGVATSDCEVLGQDQFFATARVLSADLNPGSVEVDVSSGGQAEYDSIRAESEGATEFAELSGIGDAAFFQRPFSSAEVVFLKGPFVVMVSVGFATGPPSKEAAVTLAQQAAARVPTG
jgi:hypothetical protein